MESELGKLLDTGCIEPSSSLYSSGLVLVRKKDGGLRVCVDYRGINKDTVPDCFPIPRIDDLIDMVGRCKVHHPGSDEGLPPDSDAFSIERQNSFHIPHGALSVQEDAIWPHKCSSHLSKADEPIV